jgi:RNA-splicing ligase RtcB
LSNPGRSAGQASRSRGALRPAIHAGVAEEAEFAYKDLAAVVDIFHRIDISRRVRSFTLIGDIKR